MFFIIFKGISVARNCLRPGSVPLKQLFSFLFRYFTWDWITSIQWNYWSTEKWSSLKFHWKHGKENRRKDKTSLWQIIFCGWSIYFDIKIPKRFRERSSWVNNEIYAPFKLVWTTSSFYICRLWWKYAGILRH